MGEVLQGGWDGEGGNKRVGLKDLRQRHLQPITLPLKNRLTVVSLCVGTGENS